MFKAIILQSAATLIAVLVMGWFAGTRGAVSALLGGGVCTVPNLLFALRLKYVGRRGGKSFAASFLLGELVKIVLTMALLLLVVKAYAGVHWPGLLVGMGLAVQAMFLAFWKTN